MNTIDHPVLITGGAGFVGTNLADRLLTAGRSVVVLDNLSRPGVDNNALYLQRRYGRRVRFIVGDVRSRSDLRRALENVRHVFHLAAQVAVTSSIADPAHDFEVNVLGTVNLLEEMRALPSPPSIVFTSTNKVYGAMTDVELTPVGRRYRPIDPSATAVSETRPLDFQTPYGCSKGAAEQYVLEYARSFGIPAVVFRMSCIYGPHQFGTEDQGWIAHFLNRAIDNGAITVYGDGMQVRDVLFVDDLVDALIRGWDDVASLSGRSFNIGGGLERTISPLELLDLIAELNSRRQIAGFELGRTNDQRYYVSDTSAYNSATGWEPTVGVRDGIRRLHHWLLDARRFAPAEIIAS